MDTRRTKNKKTYGIIQRRFLPRTHFFAVFSMLFLALILAAGITGCGKKTPETSQLVIGKNAVTHTIVETFAKEYYDLDDLKASVEKDVEGFNASAGGDAVSLSKFTENTPKDGEPSVVVVLKFKGFDAFSGYYERSGSIVYYYGDIADAVKKDAVSETILYENGDTSGKAVTPEQLRKMSEGHFFIATETVEVELPEDILYCSGNVTVNGNRRASVTIAEGGEQAAYILTE